MTDEELKRLFDAAEQRSSAAHEETRRHFDETAERLAAENRRHFDVATERTP